MKNCIDSQCISPGIFEGNIKKVLDVESSMSIKENDVVFSDNLNPFYASMARKAAGFIISYNDASHTIAYIREIWKSCVSISHSHNLDENQFVQVDATNGKIYLEKCLSEDYEKYSLRKPVKNKTKTKILLFLSLGRLAEKSLSINSDGVGLLRTNVIMQEIGKHPYYYIKNKIEDELITILYHNIKKIAIAC